MPEYLGYQPAESTNVDFTGLVGELNTSIRDAISVRADERASFASIQDENFKKINEYETGQNQTMNTMILSGVDNIRDLMYQWNKDAASGKMTRAQYKERHNNVMSYWESLAGAAKTFDQRTMETLKRQQPNQDGEKEGSGFELYSNKEYSKIADLKSKTIYTNPETGKVYLASVDENGKIVDQLDVRQMNNPGNLIDNRLNLNKTIAAGTKNWADWTMFTEGASGASRTVENIRQNPEFIAAKNALIRSTLSNNRAAAGVLVDNGAGDYFYYSSQAEMDKILATTLDVARQNAAEAGVEFDDGKFLSSQKEKMIAVSRDEMGVLQPSLTEKQMQAARDRVGLEIESQLGMKESGTVKRAPNYGGGSGGGAEDEGGYELYQEVRDAWIMSKSNKIESAARLTNATGGKYLFKWDEGGIRVLSPNLVDGKDGKGKDIKVHPTIAKNIKSLESLSPYFFGYGTGSKGTRESYEEFQRQKQMFLKDNPAKTTKQQSPEQWQSEWSKLPKGESMVGLDGKTYTKK